MGHGPTAKTISLTIAAVFVASCGTADRTVYFEPPTDPSTTAAPVAPTTTTSTTSAPQASAQASLREIDELLFMLTNAAGPLTAETYHFSAEFTMLDPQRPSPSSRNPDDCVLVLGVEGDAGADSAEFTIWNGVDVTDARIVGTTLWIHEDDQWHASEIAELAALSYGDWSELTVHMIGLAALVADDTTITREPWESGELVTITAVGANADSPIVEAGLMAASWIGDRTPGGRCPPTRSGGGTFRSYDRSRSTFRGQPPAGHTAVGGTAGREPGCWRRASGWWNDRALLQPRGRRDQHRRPPVLRWKDAWTAGADWA